MGTLQPEWLNTKRILSLFTDKDDYYSFLSEYVAARDSLDEIKHQLADA